MGGHDNISAGAQKQPHARARGDDTTTLIRQHRELSTTIVFERFQVLHHKIMWKDPVNRLINLASAANVLTPSDKNGAYRYLCFTDNKAENNHYLI